jgi:hypothetical protein
MLIIIGFMCLVYLVTQSFIWALMSGVAIVVLGNMFHRG